MCNLVEIANEWRGNHPDLNGGVVVIYNSEVCGWVNELRNPESWRPGSIAVSGQGDMHRATGGNDYDGAKEWVRA
jgi:hypothetical protein